MKIVVLDGYTLNPGDLTWERLKRLGDVTVYDRTPEDKIIERISEAEIIYTNKTPLTKDTLQKVPTVQFVGVLATGYNVVDTQAAKELGMVVTNVPNYSTSAVAQMTFSLLLEVCHHVWDHSQEVKKGTWTNSPDFCFWKYPLMELAEKTIGIIGFGRIGHATAKIAQAFGMKVLVYTTHPDKNLESETLKCVELDELLAHSDVISLHCPLFDSTKGIINKNTIAKMKESAIIINTSRGPLVVEEDLAEALNSGRIFGAAVDVVSTEPIKLENPLLTAKNCIITPHISWAPKESRQRLMDITVDNIEAFLKGNPINVVNK